MSLFSYCLRANCRSALFDFYVDAFKARLMLSSRSRTVENLKTLTQFQLRPLHNFYLDVPIYIYQIHAISLGANICHENTIYLIHSATIMTISLPANPARGAERVTAAKIFSFFLSQYIPLRLQNPKCANKRHIV